MGGFLAFHMLFFWRMDCLSLKLIAALFAVNCVGSMGYHSTLDKKWGRVDFDSMLLAASVSFLFFAEEFADNALRIVISKLEAHQGEKITMRGRTVCSTSVIAQRVTRLVLAALWMASLLLVFWLMADGP